MDPEGLAPSDIRPAGGVARPLLCLVTDRRRLLQATGGVEQDWRSSIQQQVEGAVRAGIDLVQIRERDLDARDLLALTRAMVELATGSKTRILVNDRLDIALSAGANGVHLRADSFSPSRILPLTTAGFVISRAVHAIESVHTSHSANIFVAGTMFPTVSKADKQEWLGLAGLATIVQAAQPTPVLAIGGVTEKNVSEVAASGACGLASIGAFVPEERGEEIGRYVVEQADRLRAAFVRAARNV